MEISGLLLLRLKNDFFVHGWQDCFILGKEPKVAQGIY